MPDILLIDNYDSFVYNIAQYLSELGASVVVKRNDSPDLDDHLGNKDGYVISPGPGHPRDTNRCLEVIRNDGYGVPVLGICLGHQAIAYVFGGKITRARNVVHGKVSPIEHLDDGLLEGIPNPLMATRYHSLVVSRDGLPSNISVTAQTDLGEIMAIRIRGKEIHGLQFHPESIMTSQGRTILSNYLERCGQ